MIRVITHQCGEVERGGESGLAMSEQITEALVGVFSGAEARELSHGPQPATVHAGVDAARVGRFSRKAQIASWIPPVQIGFGVQAADRVQRSGREFFLTLWAFRQRGPKYSFLPIGYCRRSLTGIARNSGWLRFAVSRLIHSQVSSKREIPLMQRPPMDPQSCTCRCTKTNAKRKHRDGQVGSPDPFRPQDPTQR